MYHILSDIPRLGRHTTQTLPYVDLMLLEGRYRAYEGREGGRGREGGEEIRKSLRFLNLLSDTTTVILNTRISLRLLIYLLM